MEQLQPYMQYLWLALCAVVSWFAGARMRNNSAICKLQKTIDELVQTNTDITNQYVELNEKYLKTETELCEIKELLRRSQNAPSLV